MLGPLLLVGVGIGCCFMPLNVVILSRVAAADSGAASGVLQTCQQIGGTVGLALLVTVTGGAGAGDLESAMVTSACFPAAALVVAALFLGRRTDRMAPAAAVPAARTADPAQSAQSAQSARPARPSRTT